MKKYTNITILVLIIVVLLLAIQFFVRDLFFQPKVELTTDTGLGVEKSAIEMTEILFQGEELLMKKLIEMDDKINKLQEACTPILTPQ